MYVLFAYLPKCYKFGLRKPFWVACQMCPDAHVTHDIGYICDLFAFKILIYLLINYNILNLSF